MSKLILFNFLISFLYSGCSGLQIPAAKLPKTPSPASSALFPIFSSNKLKVTQNYDTRQKKDITLKDIEVILRRDLKGEGKTFLKYAKQTGVSARFAASVAICESGGSSPLSKRSNNYFGLMKSGKPRKFDSQESCICFFFHLIKNNYHAKGKFTIKEIQKVYCPNGGEWLRNVVKIANTP